MSFVVDYDLNEFYARAAEIPVNQDMLRGFFGRLASAVCYLHNKKIRHRDTKPVNIFIKGSCVYRTDFGITLDWEVPQVFGML